jgi:hypothetical protein
MLAHYVPLEETLVEMVMIQTKVQMKGDAMVSDRCPMNLVTTTIVQITYLTIAPKMQLSLSS